MQLNAIGKSLNSADLRKKGVFGLVLVIYSGWLFYLSSQEGLNGMPLFEYQDKVEHLLAFGFMAFVAWNLLRHWSFCQRRWLWAWVYTASYGVFDEWHQLFVPGRFADVWDLLADATGAAICILLLEINQARKNSGSVTGMAEGMAQQITMNEESATPQLSLCEESGVVVPQMQFSTP